MFINEPKWEKLQQFHFLQKGVTTITVSLEAW